MTFFLQCTELPVLAIDGTHRVRFTEYPETVGNSREPESLRIRSRLGENVSGLGVLFALLKGGIPSRLPARTARVGNEHG
jgi:hypothetical protein